MGLYIYNGNIMKYDDQNGNIMKNIMGCMEICHGIHIIYIHVYGYIYNIYIYIS
jgi:hypothetical protein